MKDIIRTLAIGLTVLATHDLLIGLGLVQDVHPSVLFTSIVMVGGAILATVMTT